MTSVPLGVTTVSRTANDVAVSPEGWGAGAALATSAVPSPKRHVTDVNESLADVLVNVTARPVPAKVKLAVGPTTTLMVRELEAPVAATATSVTSWVPAVANVWLIALPLPEPP